jgi:hypothetical protein
MSRVDRSEFDSVSSGNASEIRRYKRYDHQMHITLTGRIYSNGSES